MTVSSQTSNETFIGNGVTTVWDLPFRFFDNADINVYLVDPIAQTTVPMVQGSDYTLTGAGLPEQFGVAPGTIITNVPVPNLKQLYVERVMEIEQLTDIVNQGRFFAEVHEDVFDRLTMLIQQFTSWISRALVRPVGQNYYDAEGRQIKNLGDGAADPDAVNIRTMRSYVDSSIAGVIGGFGAFIQAGVGAVVRTFQSKMRESVTAEDFGAIGEKAYHPLSERFSTLADAQAKYPFVTSLAQSIDWAAIVAAQNTGKNVKLKSLHYVITDRIQQNRGGWLEGCGIDRWDTVFPTSDFSNAAFRKEDTAGTHLYMYGTGTRDLVSNRMSSCLRSGGLRNVNGVDVALLSFYNSDAVGGSAATKRLYSAGIKLAPFSTVKSLRVIPWFDGIDGYRNRVTTGLGSDWDIGLDCSDAWGCKVENVQSVGYWRMYGILTAAAVSQGFDTSSEKLGNAERQYFYNVMAQGVRGWGIRAHDRIKVIGFTATSVTVPYDAQFHWNQESSFQLAGNGASGVYTYTGTSYDSINNTMTFTGLDRTLSAQPFEMRSVVGSNGMSFMSMIDCYASGLEHASGLRSEQLGLPASSPIELSGVGCRQPQIFHTKFQTHETCAGIFHDCLNVRLTDSQFEGKNSSTTYLLGSPFDSGPDITTPHQRGQTDDLRMVGTLISPSVNRTMFEPRGAFPDRDIFPTEGNSRSDKPFIIRNWRVGPGELQGDSGTTFFQAPASTTVLQDPRILGESFSIITGTTDVILNILSSGKNLRINNSGGTATLKVLQTGRVEALNTVAPVNDNTTPLGDSTHRWSTVFAGNGTINTSDGRLKLLRGELTDQELEAWSTVRPAVFQYLDAIDIKDEDARLHAGYIAQQVHDAFIDAGLDPRRYGLWCEDVIYKTVNTTERSLQKKTMITHETREVLEVRDGIPYRVLTTEPVERLVTNQLAVINEDGTPAIDQKGNPMFASVPVTEEVDVDVEVQIEDGTRLGLRYDQCLVFETAYLRSLLAKQDQRITALENA